METQQALSESAPLTAAEQRAMIRRITWRLMPLLFFCYIIAYIDRINVGFAKLHLQAALNVDPARLNDVFVLGSGLFFIGYFFFEVPSNLILGKVGARLWIARIMIVWGLVSMSFMFVSGVPMFYTMRFLLGVAEAGFFPGVVLYLTYWYPAQERARVIGWFALGAIAAGVIGSPLSGALLQMDGLAGLSGWQWLFLLEAIPAVVVGVVVLLVLPNGPDRVGWLSPRERSWLGKRLAEESALASKGGRHSLRDAFTNRVVWLLCLLYFLLNVGGYGFEMWLPTITKHFSKQDSELMVGLINIVPYAIAGIAMILVGRHSDRTGERRLHVAFSALAGAIGFGISASVGNPWIAMAGLTLGFVGVKSMLGPFWALGSGLLSGTAAAGGIALVNSIGNLGGYLGPALVGKITSATGSSALAMWALGGALLLIAIFATVGLRERRG